MGMTGMNRRDQAELLRLFAAAWNRIVAPYIRRLLDSIKNSEDPVRDIGEYLKRTKFEASAVTAALGGAAGATGGAVLWTASLGFWGGVGYWLGLVSMPLWAPIAGGLVGAMGVGGGVYAVLSKMSARDRERLADLYVHALTVMVHADGKVTAAEQDELAKLKSRMIGLGIKEGTVAKIFETAPTSIDRFEVQADRFTKSVLEAVLAEVWFAVLCAGSAGEREVKTFKSICVRLDVADSAATIRKSATKEREDGVKTAPAVTVAAAYSVPPEMWEQAKGFFDDALAVDFTGNAARRRAEILGHAATLAAAAAAVTAVAAGRPELLSIVGKGYATARAALVDQPAGGQTARKRALALAAQVGLDRKQAEAVFDQLDDVLSAARQGVERRPQAAPSPKPRPRAKRK